MGVKSYTSWVKSHRHHGSSRKHHGYRVFRLRDIMGVKSDIGGVES